MKFWDASALVPLCLTQPRTADARAFQARDPELVVWWGSTIECSSAIARLQREGMLTAAESAQAHELLSLLRRSWFEVQASDAITEQALRLLRLHPLRAADALQLAAALEWAGNPPDGGLVTFDERLRDAAQREGFSTP